jgi:metallo-beta-lactamase family protein
MAKIKFLGATQTVTGSKYLLSINNTNILIDCGLFQGLKELRLRNWEVPPIDISSLSAIILTHAHIDHSGYLPKLVNLGYNGPVYASKATMDLCKILLPDSARLQEEDAHYANKQGFSKHRPAKPLYTEEDAKEALTLFQPLHYEEEIEISPECKFKLISAGHILGSSFVYITLTENDQKTTVLFSGDLGRYNVPILNDPSPVPEADYVIVESTYGDRLHAGTPAKDQLAEVITRTAKRNGTIVIPAFAVGRTQEILYYIRELEDEGRIPILPVRLDSPMAQSATQQYLQYKDDHDEEMRELIHRHINPFQTHSFGFGRYRETSRPQSPTKSHIIISASGMATGGHVLYYLKECLPDPNSTIIFAGFQAEETRGRRLVEGEKEIKIHGEMVPVRAEIVSISNLSAHADYQETLHWLGEFRHPPQTVFVTHGETAAAESLKLKIEEKFGWKAVVPKYADSFDL